MVLLFTLILVLREPMLSYPLLTALGALQRVLIELSPIESVRVGLHGLIGAFAVQTLCSPLAGRRRRGKMIDKVVVVRIAA